MSMNGPNEREMERLLEEHFASGATNVPPTPDLWGTLESRLGAQDPKPLWAVLRDIGTPVDGFRFAPALAATAAVAVVAVAGGSVWFAATLEVPMAAAFRRPSTLRRGQRPCQR